MSGWLRLCSTEEVMPGSGKRFEAEGIELLLVHLEGEYYAVDAVCPHMGGDLSRGKIEGGSVVCPRHGATYELASGKMVKDVGGAIRLLTRKGAADIRSYPVQIESGNVMVKLQ